MAVGPYESVRNQIGYCGIWCGSCAIGNGALREITSTYAEMVRAYGLKRWCAKDFDYTEFEKGLDAIGRTPPCPGCLRGGGRDRCEIRSCASTRGVPDCTACDRLGSCEHAAVVEHMRAGALDAGLFVRAAGTDREELLREWTAELAGRWPSCAVFVSRR